MAKESVLILKQRIDIPDLLAQLNAALSEEWLAFYQYWIGAQVVEGAMRSDVQREFNEHAMEEFNHAKMIAERIIQLEGVPVLDPMQWLVLARCKYQVPLATDVVSLLKQNIAGERCAVIRYEEIASFTNNIDYTTCDIAKRIMAEEEEHEQDLQDYLRDVEWTIQKMEMKC
ncbi:MAG: ferritin [Bacteroidaceae bacterium]|nr:ferritin [Bacteroidaceae bacterium]